jgi:hypothetical protein
MDPEVDLNMQMTFLDAPFLPEYPMRGIVSLENLANIFEQVRRIVEMIAAVE